MDQKTTHDRRWGRPRRVIAIDRRARDRLIGPPVRLMNRVITRGVAEGLLPADVDVDWARQMLVSPIMAASLTIRERATRAQLALTVDTVLAGLAAPR